MYKMRRLRSGLRSELCYYGVIRSYEASLHSQHLVDETDTPRLVPKLSSPVNRPINMCSWTEFVA